MATSSAVLPMGNSICCVTLWIDFRAGCVSRTERKWYKHSGRNADARKSHLCPPVAERLLKQWSSGNRDFPGRLMLGRKAKGGCQPREELLSKEEVSQSSDSLSDHLAGDGGAQAMMTR